jgi:hypothetical protein
MQLTNSKEMLENRVAVSGPQAYKTKFWVMGLTKQHSGFIGLTKQHPGLIIVATSAMTSSSAVRRHLLALAMDMTLDCSRTFVTPLLPKFQRPAQHCACASMAV